MAENVENRDERISRYKEERRKQLAAQYAVVSERRPIHQVAVRGTRSTASGSASEGPRQTRASKLRAAATNAQETAKEVGF